MQNYLRFAALTIVFLFVGSLMVGFVSNFDAPESEVLAEEPVIQNPRKRAVQGTLFLANTSPPTIAATVPSQVEVQMHITPLKESSRRLCLHHLHVSILR